MSKFEVDEQAIQQEEEDPEKKFHSQLQQFIIAPYADRLPTFLNDLFTSLNFPENVLKDLKEAKSKKKQCKRNQSSSAVKSSPTKKDNDYSKSPNTKRRKINNTVYVECQT